MPLSTELSHAVARRLDADAKLPARPETQAIEHLLRIQRTWSQVPNHRVLQIEHAHSRQGEHLFIYTFAGRMANEGLGALFAHRLSEGSPQSIQVTQNDYGFCLTSSRPLPLDETRLRKAASEDDLLETLLACLNTHELSRTRFREVAHSTFHVARARVSGVAGWVMWLRFAARWSRCDPVTLTCPDTRA